MIKRKRHNIWVDEVLYREILLSKIHLQKSNPNKKVTILETTEEIGKYLNTLRNRKIL